MRRSMLLSIGLVLALVLLLAVACRAAPPTPTPTQPPATPTPTRAAATPTPTTAAVQPTATPTRPAVQPTATPTTAPTAAPAAEGAPLDTLVAQAKERGRGAVNPWVAEQIAKRKIPARRPPLPTTPPKYGGTGGGGGLPQIQAYVRQPASMDPFIDDALHYAAISDRLLNLQYGPRYSPMSAAAEPYMASKWEFTTPTTLVLTLNKGMKFQNRPPVNGREIKAADWVWSFEKMRDSPRLASFFAELSTVQSFEAVDDYTLRVNLKRPDATVTLALAATFFEVWPKELWEGGKAPTEPKDLVGSGPWTIEEWKPGSSLTLKRNPDYWGHWDQATNNIVSDTSKPQLPFLDGYMWLTIPDEALLDASFRSQKLDMSGWQRNMLKPRVESLTRTNPDATWSIALERTNQRPWMFRVDKAPFDNIKLRQAFAAAIDHEGMCDGPQSGWCVPGEYNYGGSGEWFLPPNEYGEGAKFHKYDVELAKKLLAEAGYKPGDLTVEELTSAVTPYYVAEDEVFVANLKAIGVNVKLNSIDYGASRSRINSGDFTQISRTFIGAGPDPSQVLRATFHSQGNGKRIQGVNDAKLDAMLDAMVQELDHWQRVKKVYEITRYLAVQRYSIYPGAFVRSYVAQPWIKNHQFQAIGSHGYGLITSWIDRDNPNVGFQPL